MSDTKACIVQRDRTVLLECGHPGFEEARGKLAHFAELVKSPSAFHTYRITPLSLWNAASLGWTAEEIVVALASISRWEVPSALIQDIRSLVGRYGKLRIEAGKAEAGKLRLTASDPQLLDEVLAIPAVQASGLRRAAPEQAELDAVRRGRIKQELTRLGYPVLDLAGYHEGQPLQLGWKAQGGSFALRDYQQAAADAFEGWPGAEAAGCWCSLAEPGKRSSALACWRSSSASV